MPKVLITDPLSEDGLNILKEVAEVIHEPGMPIDRIKEIIPTCDAMLVRSGTQVTKEIIEACSASMKIIGRAGVGVDNIDVKSATDKGIIVVNSPDGNTTAAAEHTLSLMMSLARNIAPANQSIKNNEWTRSKFTGVELSSKNIGIIGLGKIGTKVAEVCKALGMKIFAFDPFASAEKAKQMGIELVDDLDIIWSKADFITLHVPKTPQTANLINKDTFQKMKKSVLIINCSRGGVVNEADLAEALKNKDIAGAALDVFDEEPVSPNNPLLSLGDDVLLTPHLGAATAEAQINVAVDVAEQIKQVLQGGFATSAVNLQSLRGLNLHGLSLHMKLSVVLGAFLQQIAGSIKPESLTLEVAGDFAERDVEPLMLAAVQGYLSQNIENVSLVNAKDIAKDRGIKLCQSQISKSSHSEELTLSIQTQDGSKHSVSGIVQDQEPIITGVDECKFFLQPYEHMLITVHDDRPGIVAKVASVFAENSINISGLVVRHIASTQQAIMICGVEEAIPADLIEQVQSVVGIAKVMPVNL